MANWHLRDSPSERARLRAVHETELLDTAPMQALDQITRLASQIFNTPISLITLVDAQRQWFLSRVGMDVPETDRQSSFCSWTIEEEGVMVVNDATLDPRFAHNSLVLGDPHIVFYAGVPLTLPSGHALGSLCVIDTKTRSFSLQEEEQLATLASLAMAQIELHQRAGRVHEVTRLPNRAQMVQDMLGQQSESAGGGLLLIDVMGQQRLQAAVQAVGIGPLEDILREIARKLRGIVGDGWPIYHVAETRFCIPMRGADHSNREEFARQVLTQLKRPFHCGGLTVELAPKAGMVGPSSQIGNSADSLRRAASAIQEAVARGREYLWHDDAFDAAQKRAFNLLQDLPAALARGDFRLVFQPKLNLSKGAIAGVEALARWRHPVWGNVAPTEFIPLIENTALIHPFTRWVLQTALGQSARWFDQGIDLTMALNVSSRNLNEPGFVEQVRDICQQQGVPPQKLHIECTETAVMTNQETFDALVALRELGVQISLDDFGMGYSNLACLRELPVEMLKLDQSLIKPLETNARALDLVKSLVLMGHSLGYRMLAEGVESELVFDLVVRAGCDAVQGYYLSRPLEASDIPKFINAHSNSWSRNLSHDSAAQG